MFFKAAEKVVEKVISLGEEYDYIGTGVQIGTGFGGMRPLAQYGKIIIYQGELTLFDSKGNKIDTKPLDKIEVKSIWYTWGQSAWVFMDKKRYSVSVGHGNYSMTLRGGKLSNVMSNAKKTQQFIKAFEELKQASEKTA